MMRFEDLIQPHVLRKGRDDFSLPAKDQREAADCFPYLVARNGLRYWTTEEEVQVRGGSYLVVGVVTWSRRDMQLLDEMVARNTDDESKLDALLIFNAYSFQSVEELKRRIPGIGEVYQTPVIGIWEHGQLIQTASGFAARQLLQERFGV